MTYNPQASDEIPDKKRLNEENMVKDDDYYFIDYDNESDHEDDLYHVLYGNREDILGADFIASFLEDSDANEYVEWKNDILESSNPRYLDNISDEEYEESWYNDLEEAQEDNRWNK